MGAFTHGRSFPAEIKGEQIIEGRVRVLAGRDFEAYRISSCPDGGPID